MNDHGIPLLDFVDALRVAVERHNMHPVGAIHCHELLNEMFEAANEGNSYEVKRLAGQIQHRVKLERLWYVESWLATHHDDVHPRLRRWVTAELEAELGHVD
jgi:hypothetical protein